MYSLDVMSVHITAFSGNVAFRKLKYFILWVIINLQGLTEDWRDRRMNHKSSCVKHIFFKKKHSHEIHRNNPSVTIKKINVLERFSVLGDMFRPTSLTSCHSNLYGIRVRNSAMQSIIKTKENFFFT